MSSEGDDKVVVFTDTQVRSRAIAQAERKAAQGGGGAWMYIWEWATPAFDGKLGAVHGHDVDASFNLYRNGICGTGDRTGRLMAKRLASTFVAFAKTGNPDNDQIPHWPTYDASARATMIFDADTRVVNDPRAAIRKVLEPEHRIDGRRRLRARVKISRGSP